MACITFLHLLFRICFCNSYLIMFPSHTTYKGEVGREGELERGRAYTSERLLLICCVCFLCFFFPSLVFTHTPASVVKSKDSHWGGRRQENEEFRLFLLSALKVEFQCFFCRGGRVSSQHPWFMHVHSALHLLCFLDGEDAKRWRGGPPGAAEPADWQGENHDPGLVGKSLRELWWCWGCYSCQVGLCLLLSPMWYDYTLKKLDFGAHEYVAFLIKDK